MSKRLFDGLTLFGRASCKEIRLEVAYIPLPCQEETVHFKVSIGGE